MNCPFCCSRKYLSVNKNSTDKILLKLSTYYNIKYIHTFPNMNSKKGFRGIYNSWNVITFNFSSHCGLLLQFSLSDGSWVKSSSESPTGEFGAVEMAKQKH